MFRRDKAYVGLLVGFLYPIIAFIIVYELNDVLVDNRMLPNQGFRLQFMCIISVVANVIPAGSYVRAKKDNALKGIAGITLLLVAAIIFYFNKSLLNG